MHLDQLDAFLTLSTLLERILPFFQNSWTRISVEEKSIYFEWYFMWLNSTVAMAMECNKRVRVGKLEGFWSCVCLKVRLKWSLWQFDLFNNSTHPKWFLNWIRKHRDKMQTLSFKVTLIGFMQRFQMWNILKKVQRENIAYICGRQFRFLYR